jgi:DNA/RNA endonuclease G (NUC1)
LSDEWTGSLVRVDTFRPDPAVPADWYRVLHTDYFASGFDRGHMTPNADRDKETSMPINQATFLMSNMVPQAPDNNQGPWASMENDLRNNYMPGNELYIIAGGAGTGGTGSNGGVTTTIAGGKIAVPAQTWKVVLVLPKGDNDISRVSCSTRTFAVIMPNIQGIRNVDWNTYKTTVDAVETLTGYDFFSNLPEPVQRCIEVGINGVGNLPLDTDNDGVPDSADNCHLDSNYSQLDTDSDGIGNACDPDDDNDGVSDVAEATAGSDPLNSNSTPEICDGIDNDLNEGTDEGFPNTDGDTQANCVDADDDNDGFSDAVETTAGSDPLNANSTPEVCDGIDNDLNDGVDEGSPNTDGDGQANCVDADDDNDGFSDAVETAAGSDPLNSASTPEVCDGVDNDLNDGVDEGFTNTDGDTQADCVDTDDDGDGFSDSAEIAAGSDPVNSASTPEVCDGIDNDLNDGVDEGSPNTDGDAQANWVDADDDGDGVSDTVEMAAGSDPLNPASTPEVCDGVDNDLNEGVDEGSLNTDGDTQANCVDADDDNDAFSDEVETLVGSDPLNASSTPEVCDGVDNDIDGLVDEGFPDTDGDGISNCVDSDDDNDGQSDANEIACGSDPLNSASKSPDIDNDNIPDCVDPIRPPTNADQCKKDGWRLWTRNDTTLFKNEGDCIQFVNTGK